MFIIVKDNKRYDRLKERAISLFAIACFLFNAPLDIFHGLMVDKLNYEKHLRQFKIDRKLSISLKDYEFGEQKNEEES